VDLKPTCRFILHNSSNDGRDVQIIADKERYTKLLAPSEDLEVFTRATEYPFEMVLRETENGICQVALVSAGPALEFADRQSEVFKSFIRPAQWQWGELKLSLRFHLRNMTGKDMSLQIEPTGAVFEVPASEGESAEVFIYGTERPMHFWIWADETPGISFWPGAGEYDVLYKGKSLQAWANGEWKK
jgi:hypothetical protein